MEDIEIARNTQLDSITKIAENIGIDKEYVENYGKYKAKISLNIMKDLRNKEDGKLVLVPEVMIVDNVIAGYIRKEKLSVSEIEE